MNLVFERAKKINFIILLISAVCYFPSCATTSDREGVPFVWLTNSSKFILLPAKDIEKPLDGHQRINASFGGRDYQMDTWVKADETGMDITLLNEMGANMGELIYKDRMLSFSSAVFPPSLKPEYIAADFQFCFYKAEAIRKALEKNGLVLLTSDEPRTRRIYEKDNLIVEITFNLNYIKIINHLRGYTYTLEGDFQ